MIYLDNNATTALAPEVLEAMLPFFREHYGNASSAHALARLPEGALIRAREQIAGLLGAQPAEIVFNSGGTEGINHAFRAAVETFPAKRHVVITAVEHSAVQAVAEWLKRQGIEVTTVGVDEDGQLDLAELEAAIREDTALVSAMAANNETGVILPTVEIGKLAKARGALFHVDAVQAVGKMPIDVAAWGVDLLSLSAHKFHGPKGVGALFIRRGVRLKPFMIGGQQERGRRGGTENVPGIVGLGAAAELARSADLALVARLRDTFEEAVLRAIPEVRIHGGSSLRVPNTSSMGFRGVEGEALLLKLSDRNICVSTGSACTTGQKEPSHVLRAMRVPLDHAQGTLRFSLSRETTESEMAHVASLLPALVAELRSLRPMGRRGRALRGGPDPCA